MHSAQRFKDDALYKSTFCLLTYNAATESLLTSWLSNNTDMAWVTRTSMVPHRQRRRVVGTSGQVVNQIRHFPVTRRSVWQSDRSTCSVSVAADRWRRRLKLHTHQLLLLVCMSWTITNISAAMLSRPRLPRADLVWWGVCVKTECILCKMFYYK